MTDADHRSIRFFAEVGGEWPFFETASENITPTPADLGLSPDLAQRIEAWMDYWRAHHHWEHGWDSQQAEDQSWIEGSALIAEIRTQVSSFANVLDERYGRG
jgi:hypothetical protein